MVGWLRLNYVVVLKQVRIGQEGSAFSMRTELSVRNNDHKLWVGLYGLCLTISEQQGSGA
jgi:hypothetical protein